MKFFGHYIMRPNGRFQGFGRCSKEGVRGMEGRQQNGSGVVTGSHCHSASSGSTQGRGKAFSVI